MELTATERHQRLHGFAIYVKKNSMYVYTSEIKHFLFITVCND